MSRRPWKPEDDALAVEILANGGSYMEIMERLERTRAAVVKRMQKIGAPRQCRAVAKANQAAAMRALAADPAHRAKQRAGCLAGWANAEERRGKARHHALSRDAIGHVHATLAADPDLDARRKANTRVANIERAGRRMAWCPQQYRKPYFHLLYVKQFKAADARAIIEQDIARDQQRAIAAARAAHRPATFEERLAKAQRGEIKLLDLDVVQPRRAPLRERDGQMA